MDTKVVRTTSPRGAAQATLDRESQSVVAAIELVVLGTARRVTLANLAFGERLLGAWVSFAADRGVRISPIWPADDGPVDLVIEPIEAP